MQCMKLLWFSSIPSQLYKPLDSKPDNPLKFNPRVQLLCSSKPYDVAKTYENENGQNSVKTLPLPSHVKTITSTSNPFVKHCLKLRQSSSYRHSHGSVILVGSTPIRELYRFQNKIEDGLAAIECLLVLDNTNVPEYLNNQSIRHVNVSSLVMKKLSGLQSTDSIDMVALIRIPSTFHSVGSYLKEEDCHKWFPSPYRILVLDGVQDPGNLGTLLRSAMAFRWDGVFLLSDCCDPFNDKALRASRGASFQLPIVSGGWTHLDALRRVFHMKIVAGHPGKGAEAKPVSCLSQDHANSLVETPLCLVLGSEGNGLSETSKQECELVSIPMAGEFESLNVSVAAPTRPAKASEPPSGANIGLSAEDHFNNIFRALSSGAALVKLGFDQIRSYFSTPTPTKLPSRSAPSICKHMFDLYIDCSETYTCKKYFAPIEKYCTVTGKADLKVADSRLKEENEIIITPPEEDSMMPIPFRLILWSYHGCIEKKYWDPQRQFVCLEKYTKLLETIVDADENTVPCDKDAHQHQSVPA